MAEELGNPIAYFSSERASGSRKFHFSRVLVASAVLWLGMAGPTVASDGSDPSPSTPVDADPVLSEPLPAPPVPDPVAVEVPELAASLPVEPPQLDEPPTIAVTTESGNVNASVRVLSPGEDAQVTQGGAASGVVSPLSGADITPDPAPSAPVTDTGSSQVTPTNTNVSVRVLSPGDDGPVRQENTQASAGNGVGATDGVGSADTEAGGASGVDGAPPSNDIAAVDASLVHDSGQYHDSNSQYQSETEASDELWQWTWQLAIDCTGNVTSNSSETGNQMALDWLWTWTWDWGCDDSNAVALGTTTAGTQSSLGPAAGGGVSSSPSGGVSTDSSGSTSSNTNVSIRVLSPGDNGPVNQSNADLGTPTELETAGAAPPRSAIEQAAAPGATPDESPSEPWNWTWTFTFCGMTTSISTQTGGETALSWTWDWVWTWTCPGTSVGLETTASSAGTPTTAAPEPQPNESFSNGDSAGAAPEGAVVATQPLPAALQSLTAVMDELPTTPLSDPVPTPPLPALPAVPLPESPPLPAPPAVPLPESPPLPGPADVASVEVDVAIVLPVAPAPALPELPVPALPTSIAAAVVPDSPRRTRSFPRHFPDAPADVGLRSRPLSAAPTAVAPEPPQHRGSRPTSATRTDQASPQRTRGLLLPLNLPSPLQAAGSGGAPSGLVPSALLFGLATVIGFFVLAAPGLGRRIRLARELRPRSRYRAPIDHPG